MSPLCCRISPLDVGAGGEVGARWRRDAGAQADAGAGAATVAEAVIARANKLVEERGKDPTYVMHQLGHTDLAFTLRIYAHTMRRSEEERERLKALVQGHVWGANGPREPSLGRQAPRTADS